MRLVSRVCVFAGLSGLMACSGDKEDASSSGTTVLDMDPQPVDVDEDGDGYTSAMGDCDDSNADVNPDAEEVWYDGVDQNCDGRSDYDADGDTWDDGDDCDDTNAEVSPDAVEVCDDGVDNDCDGTVSGCGIWQDQSVSVAEATLYGDAASDRLGQGDPGVAALGDVTGDGSADLAVSAIFESTVERRQGAVYLVSGLPSGTDNIGNIAPVKLLGDDANDWAGYAVAGVGDLDGDGTADLAIGATRDDTSGVDAGVAFVLHGPVDANDTIAVRADATFTGEAAGDIAGEVAVAGDVDGDGLADLLVGAQWNGDKAGAAYVVFGPASTTGSLSAADIVYRGVATDDEVSSSLSGIGDTDGDGLADLAIAGKNVDLAGDNAGCIYVVLGGDTGEQNLGSADSILTGESESSDLGFGVSVAGAGDVNGDGYADAIFGAKSDSEAAEGAGAAYVVLGPVDSGTWSLSDADAKLLGETANNFTGDSVDGAGDLDGDGFSDVVVGSGYSSLGAEEGGAAYIVRGPMEGSISLADADGILRAAAAQDRLRVRSAGDMDADGLSDVVVTAQLADDGDAADAGAVYLFRGSGL